jgi:tetratricopeptide (TPR) repeat protein
MGLFDQLFRKKKQKLTIEEEKAKATEEAIKLFLKGYLRVEIGVAEEGIKYLDKALKINPQYAAALNAKGMGLDWLGRYEEAIRCFDRALEINPQFAWCWKQKGYTLDKLGKNEEAIKCYNKALEIDPEGNLEIDPGNDYMVT